MATPKNRFQINDEKKRFTASPESKEMSMQDKFKKFYEKGDESKNRFGDLIVARPDPVPVEPKEQPVYTKGGVRLDRTTLDMKAASDASRQNIRDHKANTSRVHLIAATTSQEDSAAIMQAFAAKHAADWHPSQFNAQNLVNGLMHCLDRGAEGITGFNLASLERAFVWLRDNNYFEPARRLRGQPAARTFEFAPVQQEGSAQQVKQRTVISAEENQQLRQKPFEQLQAEARAGYKTNVRRTR